MKKNFKLTPKRKTNSAVFRLRGKCFHFNYINKRLTQVSKYLYGSMNLSDFDFFFFPL